MTTELVLLLGLFAFILIGVFFHVPQTTFDESGPRLGARIESQLATGQSFQANGRRNRWRAPR